MGTGDREAEDVDLTLAELARLTGLTPRNIRAHQARGLLMPPVVRGRVGHYGPAHVARLRWITALQERGFNLAAIGRLLATPAPSAAHVAGLRAGHDQFVPVSRLMPRLSEQAAPGSLSLFRRAGTVRDDPDGSDGQLLAHAPLVWAASALINHGVEARAVVEVQVTLLRALQRVADIVHDQIAAHVPHGVIVDLLTQVAATDAEVALARFLAEAGGRAPASGSADLDDDLDLDRRPER